MGLNRSIGEYVSTGVALNPVTATAGGSGDAADANGVSFDRRTYGMPQSCAVDIGLVTNLTALKTVTVTVRLQDSADNSTWADFQNTDGGYHSSPNIPTQAGLQTLVVSGATTNGKSHVQAIYNLSQARRYVRAVVKPTHSNTGTDTTQLFGAIIFGGEAELPAYQPANA